MVARLKLKEIDYGTRRSLRLIDPTRGNLPGPDIVRIDRLRALSDSMGGGMAVLSWWSDLSG